MKLPIAVMTILSAGALLAQTPAAPPAHTNNGAPANSAAPAHKHVSQTRAGWRMERLTNRLNLTADQQNQVKAIFKESREQTKSLQPKLHQEREALNAAVKSGSEQQIDQILTQNAQLNTQMRAAHVKAMAKVYALLTPEQKAKFDEGRGRWAGRHKQG